MRTVLVIGIAVAILNLCATAATRYSIVTQPTSSMPYGFYFLDRQDRDYQRGSIVSVCPNTIALTYGSVHHLFQQGDCPSGVAPMVKLVAAVPGDVVTLSSRGVSVNGELLPDSRAVASYRDKTSDLFVRLPSLLYGTYRIDSGEAWVWTPHWYSFDSRYYGPLTVQGVLRPLWTRPSTADNRYAGVLWRQ